MSSSPAIGGDGTVYVGSADDKLYAINSDGSQKWAFTTGHDVISSPAICSDGTVNWEYETSNVCLEKASGEINKLEAPSGYVRNKMYLAEMQHFLDICKRGVLPMCGFSDGKKALELAWGILQSGRYNERIIFDY